MCVCTAKEIFLFKKMPFKSISIYFYYLCYINKNVNLFYKT